MARKRKKLAVWKFASCDGCQLSLLDCEDELLAVADAMQIAYFVEASRVTVKGPYDLSLVEGSITTPQRRRTHSAGAPRIEISGDHRRLRHCGRDSGAEELQGRARVHQYCLRHTRLHQRARPVHSDLRARQSGFRAAGMPDQQAPAHRSHQRLPQRAQAEHAAAQRLRGMQAARKRVRVGRARYALSRPCDSRGLRRAMPDIQSRLLRLLRAEGDAEHGFFERVVRRPGRWGTGPGTNLPHLQRMGSGLPPGERSA